MNGRDGTSLETRQLSASLKAPLRLDGRL